MSDNAMVIIFVAIGIVVGVPIYCAFEKFGMGTTMKFIKWWKKS